MINPDEKKIVMARLESMPEHMKLSIGAFGSFDKWELIKRVENEDEVGSLVVNVYMTGLRAWKKEVEHSGK